MISSAMSIWIGWDPREFAAFTVAKSSMRRNLSLPIPIHGLILSELQRMGLYQRPTEFRMSKAGRPIMWDIASDAAMSTQHANARFFVPQLAKTGWALFVDGDILVRRNLTRLFTDLDPKYAIYCVKHDHQPEEGLKKGGDVQTQYNRKNWSSVVLFNCDHPAHRRLTTDQINTVPGRDLHRFFWLDDDEIGALPSEYNHLVDYSPYTPSVAIAHFTNGTPDLPGYENCMFADEWYEELMRHVA